MVGACFSINVIAITFSSSALGIKIALFCTLKHTTCTTCRDQVVVGDASEGQVSKEAHVLANGDEVGLDTGKEVADAQDDDTAGAGANPEDAAMQDADATVGSEDGEVE